MRGAAARSAAFAALRNHDVETAFRLVSDSIASGDFELDDLYLAGQWALDCLRYADAIEFFGRAITTSHAEGESWYMDSAHLGRAYARYRSGEFDLVRADLNEIRGECEMNWLQNHAAFSKESLLQAIDESTGPASPTSG
jgi:hypothetical protein